MQWHDLLGAVLTDFFEGSPYEVQTEVDLSLKKQLLDIVVLRKHDGDFARPLPDGFAPLASHNLISFKSHQDAFDAWTALELIAYYVNYRKQVSPSLDQLLPEAQFRLIGITARYPESLAKQITLEETQPGVYDIQIGPSRIRLLVIRNLADAPVNAMLKLFSLVPKQIEFACQHYHPVHQHISGIVDELIRMYRNEGMTMATALEEIRQRLMRDPLESLSSQERLRGVPVGEILKFVSHEEILKSLPAEERLKGLPAEERLKGLPAEERLKGLPAEERLKGLPAEERLKGLSPEEIESYLRSLKHQQP